MGSIVAEIDAWIATISSNASIVANGQLPIKKRDRMIRTMGLPMDLFMVPDTTIGLNADGPTYPILGVFGTDTSVTIECGDEYVDSTANSGYGDWGNNPGHVSSEVKSGDAGYNTQVIIAYDDTDGRSFFGLGLKIGNGTGEELSVLVFKDTDGHWCFLFGEAFVMMLL